MTRNIWKVAPGIALLLTAGLMGPSAGAAGGAAPASTASATAQASLTTDSKGGYKACPKGKKIRVQTDYTMQPEGTRVTVRIYQSPSRKTKKDISRNLKYAGAGTNSVSVTGKIRVGYWSVRSYPRPLIVDQFTYARCI